MKCKPKKRLFKEREEIIGYAKIISIFINIVRHLGDRRPLQAMKTANKKEEDSEKVERMFLMMLISMNVMPMSLITRRRKKKMKIEASTLVARNLDWLKKIVNHDDRRGIDGRWGGRQDRGG